MSAPARRLVATGLLLGGLLAACSDGSLRVEPPSVSRSASASAHFTLVGLPPDRYWDLRGRRLHARSITARIGGQPALVVAMGRKGPVIGTGGRTLTVGIHSVELQVRGVRYAFPDIQVVPDIQHDAANPRDATMLADAGTPDAATKDAATLDTGTRDATALDATTLDATQPDAASLDAGQLDASSMDAAVSGTETTPVGRHGMAAGRSET